MEWQYSRTNRKHWISDGELYWIGDRGFHLFEIYDCTPYGYIRQCHKDGYKLLHKGVKIAHESTVKKLKQIVSEMIQDK